jgi:tetratricopeptide (TPR) repeat protein
VGTGLLVRSSERCGGLAAVLLKMAATVVGVGGVLLILWGVSRSMGGGGGGGYLGAGGMAFLGAGGLAAAGLVVGIIWAPVIGDLIAKPLVNLFDGGPEEAQPRPLYSMAEAKRNRGHYAEAIAQVRLQLARFPKDIQGWMMLAEIQAENLHDLAAACATLEQFLQQPGHSARNVAFALNTLAEWRLKHERNWTAARQALERIVQAFPDSPEAHAARQRLAHFSDLEQYAVAHDRTPLAVPQRAEHIGLIEPEPPTLGPVDPGDTAGDLVKHLEQFPLDNEARERLAMLYAEQYRRPDLAIAEIEQLIAQPNVPSIEVVRWLNLIADLHVHYGNELAAAEQALHRIELLYPEGAAAQNAGRRLKLLRLEGRRNESRQAVRLGSYEQNLGLKGSAPRVNPDG